MSFYDLLFVLLEALDYVSGLSSTQHSISLSSAYNNGEPEI